MTQRVAGIDVGGTFTDLIIYESDDGEGGGVSVRLAKTPSTPANQAIGVVNAIAKADVTPGDIDLILHGTTTTTNAVLERKIAQCGLITTKGFRDVLELGRRTRPNPYGMTGTFEALVTREFRLEVDERITARGDVVTPLNEDDVRAQVAKLIEMGAESLIIHFLHAYANPAHELRAAEIARELWPNSHVTLGHEILSEYREYERGTTASINAAVRPVLHRYIQDLQKQLADGGYQRELLVMTGNGGTATASNIAEQAAKTVMSGPASGVMAAARIADDAGFDNVITYDMGGTSSDVALVSGGVPEISSELAIDYGLPIHVPMIDVRTVGAGGGSIGWINSGGLLNVGPESAGANPGPICYGLGGLRPTITDANLLLGRLDPNRLPLQEKLDGGALDQIRAIFAKEIADPLGLDIDASAQAMVTIANTQMAGAVRMVSIARGHDPRDFALLAFGGAGPLHAASMARELAIPRVLVPLKAGMINALGCLIADLRQDMVNTLNQPLDDVDIADVHEIFDRQIAHGLGLNADQADEVVGTNIIHWADMQFKGQTHLIRVQIPSNRISKDELQKLFEAAYLNRFQVELPEIKAVLVNLNTSVIGLRPPIGLEALLTPGSRKQNLEDAQTGTRKTYFNHDWHETPIFDRESLPETAEIAGPAIIEQSDTTTWIEPGTTGRSDHLGNLIIQVPVGQQSAPAVREQVA